MLHQSDHDTPQHMNSLILESEGCAVLDCGAPKTVAGASWWKMLYENFSADLQKLCRFTPSRYFKFGDGEKYRSRIGINFPGKLGNKNIRIEADIDADIPLLFSKDSMKKAGMSVNFMTDTITFQGQQLSLTVTKSGHYIFSITREMHALQVCDTLIHVMMSTKSSIMTKKDMAAKLHCKFAHAPVERVISLQESR